MESLEIVLWEVDGLLERGTVRVASLEIVLGTGDVLVEWGTV